MGSPMNASCRWLLRSSFLLALLASASAGQSLRLSGPLIDPASDVTAFAVDTVEGRAYYLADQETRGVVELYGLPLDRHAPPVKLSDKLPAGADVTALLHRGRSKRVVYRVDAPTSYSLFSVMGSGNEAPIRLSPPLPRASQFELAADGTRLFYSPRQTSSGFGELFVVPVDGSEPPQAVMKLSLRQPLPHRPDFHPRVLGSPSVAWQPIQRDLQRTVAPRVQCHSRGAPDRPGW